MNLLKLATALLEFNFRNIGVELPADLKELEIMIVNNIKGIIITISNIKNNSVVTVHIRQFGETIYSNTEVSRKDIIEVLKTELKKLNL